MSTPDTPATPPASPTPPTPPAPPQGGAPYPVQLDIEYAGDGRNRVTVLFRIILAIPVLILIAMFQGGNVDADNLSLILYGTGFIFVPTVILLLFRHRYPRWWFDFNVNLLALFTRVTMYVYLLRDEYPSTEDRQALDLKIPYPDAKSELSRGLPLIKWLLAIPHYIVLALLGIVVFFVVIIAWFAILFTGRLPQGLHDFLVGYTRWSARVYCYSILLTTDRYPPFRLSP
jgi:hypothetical protein